MTKIALSIAIVLAASGAALAAGSAPAVDFNALSPAQLDALTNILAGLPRN